MTVTFPSGANQPFTVPSGVTQLTITATGAAGQNGLRGGVGGGGGGGGGAGWFGGGGCNSIESGAYGPGGGGGGSNRVPVGGTSGLGGGPATVTITYDQAGADTGGGTGSILPINLSGVLPMFNNINVNNNIKSPGASNTATQHFGLNAP